MNVPDLLFFYEGESRVIKAYPRVDSSEFSQVLRNNWKGALKNKSSFNDFIFWLCLCIDRPWIKKWRFSIRDKTLDQVMNILVKNRIEAPDLGDPSTFRKRFRQPKAKEKIIDATFPEHKILGQIMDPWRSLFSNLEFKKAFRIKSRFVGLVCKGPISQRDLMRKLRVSKNKMTGLVEWAGDDIELRHGPRGTVNFCDGFRPETAVNDRIAQDSRRGGPSSPAGP